MITEEILNKLEYRKVLSYISHYATTELAKIQINNLLPYSSSQLAEKRGKLVSQAKEVLINSEYPPINFLTDLRDVLAKSNIEGSVLKKKEILNILELARISRKLFSFLKSNSNDSELYKDFSERFFIDKNFENHLSKVFNEAGEIKDNASKKLGEIRKEIISKNSSLKHVIEKILKGLSNSYLVQEEYVTQRDGRLVVPIKAEHKRHVKGFIHSESNTGQTVYIEPEETLELNNEILTLSFAEKREVEKILRDLTKLIGKNSLELKHSFDAVTELDIIFAKAKYSLEIIGEFPRINFTTSINLIDARHPILLKKINRDKTIPLNFKYDGSNKVTLITGPNAGGKTVVLKTIGLLAALVQSGIHVPVHPDSEIIFFNEIMLDIGDEQSIEEDLSTFSSHLNNIKNILESADENTLVLIDEIGTGTDPSEGTALAASFLIKLAEKNSVTIATTHHGNLKIIASELEGFQNASMEYDLKKLSPTYKFRQGIPGSSYAFEVASKIGLDHNIISLAKNYLDSDKNKIETFIVDLENKSLELTKKLNQVEIENARLKGLTNLYEQENKKLKSSKNKIIKETKEEAEKFLKNVNSEFENTIKKIKETKADKKIIVDSKRKINNIKNRINENLNIEDESENDSKVIEINDFVRIKDSFTTGRVVEIDNDKKIVTIETGSLRIKAKSNNLIISKPIKNDQVEHATTFVNSVESSTLDIRGKKPEDVEFEIIKFIDDAYLTNLKMVNIIHGKGTGVLRKTVHHLLKKHELVSSFELAGIESGGEGLTIVLLKR